MRGEKDLNLYQIGLVEEILDVEIYYKNLKSRYDDKNYS